MQFTDHQTYTSTSGAPNHFNICESGAITLKNSDEQAEIVDDDCSSDGFDDQDDQSDNFAKELEERIQADLEIESIFSSVPQARSFSLGKSLPERPCNPIIKDKFFKEETWDSMSLPNSRVPVLNDRHVYLSKYRECSLERQRIIIQEDFEAVNEMHQLLLSPQCNGGTNDVSSGSKTSISEISSLESDFSRMLTDEHLEDQ
jgi:hypothetical protein